MDNISEEYLYHSKSMTFRNKGIFTLTSSVQDLLGILNWHTFQSLEKALSFKKNCKSDVHFLNRRKNVLVATHNFGSV